MTIDRKTGEKQHFVPVTYLKQFAGNLKGEVFGSQLISGRNKWAEPKLYNPSRICYREDFYELLPEQARHYGIPNDFVERRAFLYEDGFSMDLLPALKSNSISREQLTDYVYFYLSMKHRNPAFRMKYEKTEIVKNVKDTKQILSTRLQPLKEKGIDVDSMIDDAVEFVLANDPEKMIHNQAMVANVAGEPTAMANVFTNVMKYFLVRCEIVNEGSIFVTCDNPGFSISKAREIHNTKFKDDLFHFMPLSPQFGIILCNPENRLKFELDPITKRVYPDESMVKSLNRATILNRTKFVYGSNSDLLKAAVEEVC